jgi:thiol-disulfide isomerase/thioredoxin
MNLGDRLPSFDGATAWFNSQPSTGDLAGHVVLVHFWSGGCPLCHEAVVDIDRWRACFAARGLITLSVYQPRPNETIDIACAERDARTLMRIGYPCAVDGTGELASRFDSIYAPGYYVFDRANALRHRQMGNGRLDGIDELLGRLCERDGESPLAPSLHARTH